MDNKTIGNRIKSRRKDLNLTLKEVADIVGVASSTIQRYENGTITQYKLPVLESIAKALNVNPTWFVREDAPMNIMGHSNELKNITKENAIEVSLLANFNKLNNKGKEEAIKRVEELTYINKYIEENSKIVDFSKKEKRIWELPGKEHLMPIASHCKNGDFSEDDVKYDDKIMDNEDLWK